MFLWDRGEIAIVKRDASCDSSVGDVDAVQQVESH